MNSLTLSTFFAGLIDVTFRASALLLLAFAVTLLLRRASAASRHLVWAAALTGAVLLPLLSATLPALRLPLPAGVASVVASVSNWTSPAASGVSDATDPVGQIEVGAQPGESAGSPGSTGTLIDLVMLLWIAGAVLMVGKLMLGVLSVSSLGRRSSMLTDGAWLQLSHEIARRLGATRGVTLLQGEGPAVPMTWGVLQPVIWLPAEAEGWTEERRRVVLAHELAHVRRRDALTQWIGHLAVAVYWFNPLVWMAVRRLQEERERACDDVVLRLGTPSTSYADHLLQVARGVGLRMAAPHAAMAMARHSPLVGRTQAILDRSTARDSVAGRRGLVMVALAAGFVVPLAALRAEAAGVGTAEAPAVADPSEPQETGLQNPAPDASLTVPSTAGQATPDGAGRQAGAPEVSTPPTAPGGVQQVNSRDAGAPATVDRAVESETSNTNDGASSTSNASSSSSNSRSTSSSNSANASSDGGDRP